MNNISTFLAELADLMEKHEIDSLYQNNYSRIEACTHSSEYVDLGYEVTPEFLFKLSKELENDS